MSSRLQAYSVNANGERFIKTTSGRKIGYCVFEKTIQTDTSVDLLSETTSTTASLNDDDASIATVIVFHALGSSAHSIDYLTNTVIDNKFGSGIKTVKLISIQRPDVGETDCIEESILEHYEHDIVKAQILQHTQDCSYIVQEVEKVRNLYVFAACLGHAYAASFCLKMLLKMESGISCTPKIRGISMLAPFVSPACPDALGVARFANSIPSVVSSVGIGMIGGSLATLAPLSFSSIKDTRMFQGMLTEDARKLFMRKKVGSNEEVEDLEENAAINKKMTLECVNTVKTEMKIGTSDCWQCICDALAAKLKELRSKPETFIPLLIFGGVEDTTTPYKSVKWIAEEVYGCKQEEFVTLGDKFSHEIVIFGGGPVWNALFTRKILNDWGLIDAVNAPNENSNVEMTV